MSLKLIGIDMDDTLLRVAIKHMMKTDLEKYMKTETKGDYGCYCFWKFIPKT